MTKTFDLDDAKKGLSALVDRAAAGEEIVIAKDGKPMARLAALGPLETHRSSAGALGMTYMAPDFDEPLPVEVLRRFGIE